MSSAGILEPAAIPVRRCWNPSVDTEPFCISSSSALNMVGTPYRAVHRSSWTLLSVASALKASAGNTIVDPWVAVAM